MFRTILVASLCILSLCLQGNSITSFHKSDASDHAHLLRRDSAIASIKKHRHGEGPANWIQARRSNLSHRLFHRREDPATSESDDGAGEDVVAQCLSCAKYKCRNDCMEATKTDASPECEACAFTNCDICGGGPDGEAKEGVHQECAACAQRTCPNECVDSTAEQPKEQCMSCASVQCEACGSKVTVCANCAVTNCPVECKDAKPGEFDDTCRDCAVDKCNSCAEVVECVGCAMEQCPEECADSKPGEETDACKACAGPKCQACRPGVKAQPEDCIWGEWEDWTTCTVSCGPGGIRERVRTPAMHEENDGKECSGASHQSVNCDVVHCPQAAAAAQPYIWSKDTDEEMSNKEKAILYVKQVMALTFICAVPLCCCGFFAWCCCFRRKSQSAGQQSLLGQGSKGGGKGYGGGEGYGYGEAPPPQQWQPQQDPRQMY